MALIEELPNCPICHKPMRQKHCKSSPTCTWRLCNKCSTMPSTDLVVKSPGIYFVRERG